MSATGVKSLEILTFLGSVNYPVSYCIYFKAQSVLCYNISVDISVLYTEHCLYMDDSVFLFCVLFSKTPDRII